MPGDTPLFTDAATLRRHVINVANGECNPRLVTDKVLGEVSTVEELRVIAEVCLRAWVWEQLKQPHAPQPLGEVRPRTAEQDATAGFPDADGNVRASARQAAFVNLYRKELTRAVKVGDGENDQKPLAQCTIDDLTWMVGYRRKVADQNLAVAVRFEKLAQAMAVNGARTVADLERAVAEPILLG